MNKSFEHARGLIEAWGYARRITVNGTVTGQLQKVQEEAEEGIDAISLCGDIPTNENIDLLREARADLDDALGDVGVAWLMACATAGRDPVDMLYLAHEEIKDRTGHLGDDGIFYKDE